MWFIYIAITLAVILSLYFVVRKIAEKDDGKKFFALAYLVFYLVSLALVFSFRSYLSRGLRVFLFIFLILGLILRIGYTVRVFQGKNS